MRNEIANPNEHRAFLPAPFSHQGNGRAIAARSMKGRKGEEWGGFFEKSQNSGSARRILGIAEGKPSD
jgi:hypothetical protein